jgi:hypothetical protein
MKYGDERDRLSPPRLSRRQFLTSGGQHAARLAAGMLPPGAAERLVESSLETSLEDMEPPPDDVQP